MKTKHEWILTSRQLQPEARTAAELSGPGSADLLLTTCLQSKKQKVVTFGMKMQQKSPFTGRRAVVVIFAVLLLMGQQVCTRPSASQAQSGSKQQIDVDVGQPLRRNARMTPLWRIMSSKPPGAFCQNNFECSTGFCRAGHCATNQRSEAVKS